MKKEEAIKESRETRRIREEKHNYLMTLINLFLTERSACQDPEGDEADQAFVKYRNMWIEECKKFNKGRKRPITLRGAAFSDTITNIIEKEKIAQAKANQEKVEKAFGHYLRREQIMEGRLVEWTKRYFFRNLWYNIISLSNKEKVTKKWKTYYGNQFKN